MAKMLTKHQLLHLEAVVKDNNVRGKTDAAKIFESGEWPKECKDPSDIHDFLEKDSEGKKWLTLK